MVYGLLLHRFPPKPKQPTRDPGIAAVPVPGSTRQPPSVRTTRSFAVGKTNPAPASMMRWSKAPSGSKFATRAEYASPEGGGILQGRMMSPLLSIEAKPGRLPTNRRAIRTTPRSRIPRRW